MSRGPRADLRTGRDHRCRSTDAEVLPARGTADAWHRHQQDTGGLRRNPRRARAADPGADRVRRPGDQRRPGRSRRAPGPTCLAARLSGRRSPRLPPPVEPVEPTEEVIGWMRDLGWQSCLDSPLLGSLTCAVADARAAGVPLSASGIADYAKAVLQIAAVDVAVAASASSPAAALHTVVVGTVMVDPVIATLRRLAQEVQSARVLGA